jgi:hypothetical protein
MGANLGTHFLFRLGSLFPTVQIPDGPVVHAGSIEQHSLRKRQFVGKGWSGEIIPDLATVLVVHLPDTIFCDLFNFMLAAGAITNYGIVFAGNHITVPVAILRTLRGYTSFNRDYPVP